MQDGDEGSSGENVVGVGRVLHVVAKGGDDGLSRRRVRHEGWHMHAVNSQHRHKASAQCSGAARRGDHLLSFGP